MAFRFIDRSSPSNEDLVPARPEEGALLEIRAISDPRDLRPFAAAWDRLAAEQPGCVPMFAHSWVDMLFTVRLPDDERPMTLLALEDEVLVGVLPLYVREHRVLGVRRRSARIPCEYQSRNGDALVEPARADEVLTALVRAVPKAVGRLHAFEVGCVADDAPTAGFWRRGPAGFRFRDLPDGTGSRVPLGDLEAWEQGLSKGLQRDLKRGRNKLERESIDVRYAFHAPGEADPAFFEEFAALEASGWKGKEGTAILSYPENEAKHRHLLAAYAERGWLEWHTLHLDGELAAAHWVVRMSGSAMLLKQAYDEAWSKHHAGHLLLYAAIVREHERVAAAEAAPDAPAPEFNLVTDWPWCRRWGMAQRAYTAYRLFPRKLLPSLLGAWPEALKRTAKRLLKREPDGSD